MRSAQARSIRRKLVGMTLLFLGLFAVLYWVFIVFAGHGLYQQAAYLYADITSPWSYVTDDTYNRLKQSQGDVETIIENTPFVQSSAFGQGKITYSYDLGFWTDGTSFAIRDLSGYHAFLSYEETVYVVVFFIGCLVIGLIMLARSTRYLDELSCAVTRLMEADGKPIELSNSLSLIRSELIDIQARNIADRNAAAMAEQRKNELVAYLAHDIRTPLTSVIGYLDLLRESPELTAEQRAKYTGIAYEKAVQLEGLVAELFDITRYNLHAIPIEREQVDLALFASQVADEFYPEAEARGIDLQVKAPIDEKAFIDPSKMARALGNVLRNALAFADPASTVYLSASIEGERALMHVTDTGKEISPAHLETIFEKFYREDAARSASSGGAGLGLAIAREIVEAHGGTISATSDKGVTTFTIDVPR